MKLWIAAGLALVLGAAVLDLTWIEEPVRRWDADGLAAADTLQAARG